MYIHSIYLQQQLYQLFSESWKLNFSAGTATLQKTRQRKECRPARPILITLSAEFENVTQFCIHKLRNPARQSYEETARIVFFPRSLRFFPKVYYISRTAGCSPPKFLTAGSTDSPFSIWLGEQITNVSEKRKWKDNAYFETVSGVSGC